MANAIYSKNTDIDLESMRKFLLSYLKIFPSVSSFYFGYPNGGLVSVGKSTKINSFESLSTYNENKSVLEKFELNREGEKIKKLELSGNNVFDSSKREWFSNAISSEYKEKARWGKPYLLFTGQDYSISVSKALYDKNDSNKPIGIFGADIFLENIERFVKQLEISKGFIVIVDETNNPIVISDKNMKFKNVFGFDSVEKFIVSMKNDNLDSTIYNKWHTAIFSLSDNVFNMELPQWKIIVSSNSESLVPEIKEYRNTAIFLAVFFTLGMVFIGAAFSKKISSPMEKVAESAEKFCLSESEFFIEDTDIEKIYEDNNEEYLFIESSSSLFYEINRLSHTLDRMFL